MKIGNLVRFRHEQYGGPVHRVVSVMSDGMIEVNDMAGYFNPHLFVAADDVAAIPQTRKIHHRVTQWAEMKPNVYAGEDCNQVAPRWEVSSEGDKGDSDFVKHVVLDARTFPPGTKITIEEPVCPQCGDCREQGFPITQVGTLFSGPCRCGFDWDNWVLEQYS